MNSCPKRYEQVTEYVDASISQKITIQQMAERACVSAFYFARDFKRFTGMTPMAYVTERRLICAKARLAAGVSIALAALSCGFCSQSHMTRAFKAHTGKTPAQYQRDSIKSPG